MEDLVVKNSDGTISTRLAPTAISKEVVFLEEIIQILKSSLKSENPQDYDKKKADNLDVFSWGMAESAKESNAGIKLVIEKLEVKKLGAKAGSFLPPPPFNPLIIG